MIMKTDSHDTDAGLRNADRIYAELRGKILAMDLLPGAILDEARIVQESGMSRTPIREAAIRLVSEGLLVRDGRQIRVAAFDISQLHGVFESLVLLSRAMHRMAALRREPPQLKTIWQALLAFEAEVETSDETRLSEANHVFHMAISKAAASPVLHGFYQTVSIDTMRLSRQCFIVGARAGYADDDHLKHTMRDHRTLFEAIEAGDGAAADRVALHHSVRYRERLMRRLLGRTADIDSIDVADVPTADQNVASGTE